MKNKIRSRKEIKEILDKAEIQKKDKDSMGKADKKKYILISISIFIILSIIIFKFKNSGTIDDDKYRSDVKSYFSQLEDVEKKYNEIKKEALIISNKLEEGEVDRNTAKKEIQDLIYESEKKEKELSVETEIVKKGEYKKLIRDSKDNLLNVFINNREGLENYIALIELGGSSPLEDPAIISKYEEANSNLNDYKTIKEKIEYKIKAKE
ncbi:MAG: hypothetical protein Q4P31_04030, partial [Andreesenia angusta]|nr:hypothetical protein [Andreesenia angusta]